MENKGTYYNRVDIVGKVCSTMSYKDINNRPFVEFKVLTIGNDFNNLGRSIIKEERFTIIINGKIVKKCSKLEVGDIVQLSGILHTKSLKSKTGEVSLTIEIHAYEIGKL